MKQKKELSQLAKTILSGAGHITTFTQSEFDDALALGKAEIMKVAIDTTKTAIKIERNECAKVVREWTGELDLEAIATAVEERLTSQRSQ
jgi:peptide subunit release factor 1 (eRF1)